MGEYADMIVNGEACQICMMPKLGSALGYPYTCRDCNKSRPVKILCPICKRAVKPAGLIDHKRAVHEAKDEKADKQRAG